MKQSNLVIILLIVLIIGGWGTALLSKGNGETEEYIAHMELADEYVKRGLFQKAIEEYDAALLIKDEEEVWTIKLDAYEKRYQESEKIYDDYLVAVQQASAKYSNNTDYILTLAELYLTQGEYSSAHKVLKKAVESGVDDNRVNALLKKTKYSYELKWDTYDNYKTCVNGYYAVSNEGYWSYIEENGTGTDYEQLLFAGPVGENGIRVLQDLQRSQLVDEQEVVQSILNFEPQDAGCFSEGLVAIRKGDSYSYYDILGDKQFGDYDNAGTFINGIAAVQQGEKWILIDNKGDSASQDIYEDIVLHADGAHVKNGVMIAKKDGIYKFYKDEEVIGEYSDSDIITNDNIIAVCKNGKWGYVDCEGKEIITPIYAEAKSFSNGLAAVYNGKCWGFIDLSGELVIDYMFSNVDYFNSEGCCLVQMGDDLLWRMISLYIK